jgi:dolichol-phosphate mannosyltransferase
MQPTLDYSVVIPVYYNEGALTKTMDALKEQVIARNQALRGEVIFIDDGSGDGSFTELLRLRERDPELIKVIKLTRNFGQVSALIAGYHRAKGRCVVSMSADGQDPVDLINQMLDEFRTGNIEIVAAARQERDESWFRIWTSRLFYWLMRKLSFPNMPLGGFDFFLVGRRALDAILHNREAHPFVQGQILWTGFPIKFIYYRRRKREIGKSRWSFGKKLTALLDGLMSYSFLPIRMMSITGGLVALAGFLYAVDIFIGKLVWGNPVQGWAPLMIVLLVVSGIQLLMLGVIGEYLWRTLAQVRQREPYIIEAVYE